MGTETQIDCINHVAFGFAKACPTTSFATVEYEWIFWLSVATSSLFVALAVPRILHLIGRPAITRAPVVLFPAKMIFSVIYAGLRLGLFVVALRDGSHRTPRLVASTALDFVASFLLVNLSPLEHFKSPRPSIAACSFLSLILVCDLSRCPSLWTAYRFWESDKNYIAFASLFTASIIIEFTFLALESSRRRQWVAWNAADHSPEETSSIISLSLYSWVNPLFWKGYREPLAMHHLYAPDQAISTETIDIPGSKLRKATSTSTWHLLLWLGKPLGVHALFPIFPRLCLIGFTFCQPLFLQRLLEFLKSRDNDSSTESGLITVTVLIYAGIAIFTALYWYYQERFQSRLRAFLISSIYHKTEHILHIGDGDDSAVTLMGADVERVYTGLRLMHEVWASVIQIALATWLLQPQLGLAVLAPLVTVMCGFAAAFAMSRRAVKYQSAWMSRVQARISTTSAVLARIKDLRVSGMTEPAAALLQREREEEISVGERSRALVATSASLSQLPQALAPALAFAFGPRVMDETCAYKALSLLTLLTAPLMIVLQSLPILAACIACLRRIKTYLDKEGRVDKRVFGSRQRSDMVGNPGAANENFIAIHDGFFGWTNDDRILKKINMCLPKSSITFVIGPVASGKSILCRALLGELPFADGTVILGSKKMAFCDQNPFLFNSTIMENIIGFASFDASRYAEVIKATALETDFANLPAGDKTMIGTKGVSLSGGQRQRVSLARALYHDAEIIVLDDVFSGLDGPTQKILSHSILGPNGLLRTRGATAVICTHSTQFLATADHIIKLSNNGTIEWQGRRTEITHKQKLARQFGIADIQEPVIERSLSSPNEIIEARETVEGQTASPGPRNTQGEPQNPPTRSIKTVDKGIYRHWLSTIGPFPLMLYAIFAIGLGFCSNYPTIWLKMWSEDSTSESPKHSFAFWIGIYALLGAGILLCVFPGGSIMMISAVRLSGRNLHHAAVSTVMHSSLRFLSNTDVGKVLNLFSQDMNILDTQLPRMVNNMCFPLTNAIGMAVVIAMSSAWLAISYPFLLAILWVVQRIYLPTSKRLRILDLEAKSPLYTNFLDTISGLPTIRSFGWFPHHLARNNSLLDDSQRPSYLLAIAQQWLTLTMNILVGVLAIILVVLATKLESNAGNVGAGLVTLITLGVTLSTIITAYTGLETSLGAISRLKSFGEETEMEDYNRDNAGLDKSWPMSGNIQIQDVNASYNGTDNVLKALTLSIQDGEKVAICGRTGSGKSSIVALLLCLIDPSPASSDASNQAEAAILIDGVPLSSIDPTTLRKRVIAASQDPVFLPDGISFRTNLDPWSEASDEECAVVLRDHGLEVILKSKGGLDAPLNGSELSSGQKQLFSLARAVLRQRVKFRETGINKGLLLLDEITSNADAETEQQVRKILEKEFSEYTVVIVTHRREMAMFCDRVVVMDAGILVEDQSTDELSSRQGFFQ